MPSRLAKACPSSVSISVPAIGCTTIKGKGVVVVLCGGDKKSQAADIKEAKALASDV